MRFIIIIPILFIFSNCEMRQNKAEKKSLISPYTMRIEPICASKNYNECLGIILDKRKETLYFATNGKYIHKFNLLSKFEPSLISTINEVAGTWNDNYGDTFLHEMKLGNDGYIYAVAENCILKINPENGAYSIIISEGFSGPWGAYGLELDSVGNMFVGDHHGGIHVYLKNKNWQKKTIIAGSTENGIKKSFGSMLLKNDTLYYLDFENSALKSASFVWKNDFPEIIETKTLSLPVPYPEFMQLWKGDILIKAARENTMLRVRNNEVIQRIGFTSDKEVSPIVTFSLDRVDDNKWIFYGTSWGPNAMLYRGELIW
jgi:hypothetical protein